jgi:hypothetical protein
MVSDEFLRAKVVTARTGTGMEDISKLSEVIESTENTNSWLAGW